MIYIFLCIQSFSLKVIFTYNKIMISRLINNSKENVNL